MEWRWDFTWEILPRLIVAAGNTLLAAGIGYAIAVVLGLVLALAQRTPWIVLTWAVREAVEFIRSTPLVLQIFFVFYVFPQFGVRLSPWVSGMIAIGLHYAAYLSEVYRAGIDGVPRGQWEACRALNLSTRRTYFGIVIPQAPGAQSDLFTRMLGQKMSESMGQPVINDPRPGAGGERRAADVHRREHGRDGPGLQRLAAAEPIEDRVSKSCIQHATARGLVFAARQA